MSALEAAALGVCCLMVGWMWGCLQGEARLLRALLRTLSRSQRRRLVRYARISGASPNVTLKRYGEGP